PSSRPTTLRFLGPSPNPAQGAMRFGYALPGREDRVEIGIYDVGGREVRRESLGPKDAGLYSWVWNGKDAAGQKVPAGVFFARLQVGARTLTEKALRIAR